jgi:hypothetical protein
MFIQLPPDQKLSPIGGGCIRYPLFNYDTSYCEYSSVDELEAHLNKVFMSTQTSLYIELISTSATRCCPLLIFPRCLLLIIRMPLLCALRGTYVFIIVISMPAILSLLISAISVLLTLTKPGFYLRAS